MLKPFHGRQPGAAPSFADKIAGFKWINGTPVSTSWLIPRFLMTETASRYRG
jgi:hypothetical protein